MTFSLVGYCERTGMVGMAVTTSSICVGARCVWVEAGVGAVATPEVVTPMVMEERKTMTAVGAKLKSTAGSLELQPACDAIMKQLKARKFLVIPGVRARLVALSARLFPGVLRWFSERMVVSLLRKESGRASGGASS